MKLLFTFLIGHRTTTSIVRTCALILLLGFCNLANAGFLEDLNTLLDIYRSVELKYDTATDEFVIAVTPFELPGSQSLYQIARKKQARNKKLEEMISNPKSITTNLMTSVIEGLRADKSSEQLSLEELLKEHGYQLQFINVLPYKKFSIYHSNLKTAEAVERSIQAAFQRVLADQNFKRDYEKRVKQSAVIIDIQDDPKIPSNTTSWNPTRNLPASQNTQCHQTQNTLGSMASPLVQQLKPLKGLLSTHGEVRIGSPKTKNLKLMIALLSTLKKVKSQVSVNVDDSFKAEEMDQLIPHFKEISALHSVTLSTRGLPETEVQEIRSKLHDHLPKVKVSFTG